MPGLRMEKQASFDSQATLKGKPATAKLLSLDLEDDFLTPKRKNWVDTGSLSSRSLSGFSSSTASSEASNRASLIPIFIGGGCIARLWHTSRIFDEIIAYLENDTRALQNISLSCRSLRQAVIPFLFHRISIPCYPRQRKTWGNSMLEMIGGRSRHLIPYITHVVLSHLFPDPSSASDPVDENALRVLLNLSCIRRISIHGSGKRSWLEVNEGIQKAIRTTLCMPTKRINAIEVTRLVDFPVYLLGACKYLRDLSLEAAVSCAPRPDSHRRVPGKRGTYDHLQQRVMLQTAYQDAGTRPTIYLERLKFTGETANLVEFGDLLLSAGCPFHIGRLKALEVNQQNGFSFLERQRVVSRILSQCWSTLEELHLDAYGPGRDVDIHSPSPSRSSSEDIHGRPSVIDTYTELDLGQLKCLRRLSLKFGLSNVQDEKGHLLLLSQMLRNVQSLRRLETIALTLSGLDDDETPSQYPESHPISSSWGVFDRCLSTVATRDGSCPTVRIMLEGVPVKRAEQIVEICLPSLYMTGGIQILEDPLLELSLWDW
ncbi:hypothetical protein BKA70DRAFT_1148714 [Coprinopsis sp. MPI-PUGE-AT-0042]|nr:hypothetical protein BKA70DRAFT_1148714 [Coprinopsis sp. MPI-PUGE-AT-0042]